jgi:hypothetical protein
MAYVYRHIRLDKNEPFYIGIGSEKTDRASVFTRAYEKARRSEMWKSIVAKSDYEVEILFSNVPPAFAKQKEIELISLYGRKDLGTGCLANMTDGGDGLNNRVFTEEYRRKLSEAAKKRPPQAQLQKIIEWRKANTKLSEETKRRISDGVKGKNLKGIVRVFDSLGEIVGDYRGVHECANKLNVNASAISACLNDRRARTGGYTFKRLTP